MPPMMPPRMGVPVAARTTPWPVVADAPRVLPVWPETVPPPVCAGTDAVCAEPPVEPVLPAGTDAVLADPPVEPVLPAGTDAVCVLPPVEPVLPAGTDAVCVLPPVEPVLPAGTEAVCADPLVEPVLPIASSWPWLAWVLSSPLPDLPPAVSPRLSELFSVVSL